MPTGFAPVVKSVNPVFAFVEVFRRAREILLTLTTSFPIRIGCKIVFSHRMPVLWLTFPAVRTRAGTLILCLIIPLLRPRVSPVFSHDYLDPFDVHRIASVKPILEPSKMIRLFCNGVDIPVFVKPQLTWATG